MKKQSLWKIGLMCLLAFAGVGCESGSGGFNASPAVTTSGSVTGDGNENTAAAVTNSPGAAEFLARNSFLGFASLTDRSLGQNRYLVFTSRADLIPTDTNGQRDVYLRDLRTATMHVVSVASDGTQGNGDSTRGSISADGRFVVFRSAADNLVIGDGNGVEDVFLHEVATGTTTRISVDSSGTEANGASDAPAITANGNYVVFASKATNLVGTDGNMAQDIFLRDLTDPNPANHTTTLVSTNSANTDSANGASYDPAITAGTTTEGEFIAFTTEATDMISGLINGQRHVVRIERVTPANRVLISQSAGGAHADAPCYEPSISNDGNNVAFFTLASNLGAVADANNFFDVYQRNVSGNTTTCLSLNTVGNPGNNHSGYPSLSADGSVLAFGSLATDLVTGDSNGRFDVFRRTGGTTELVSQATDSTAGNSDSDLPGISLDGRWVAFRSAASTLVSRDATVDDDVFVRDSVTPSTFWATVSCLFPAVWPGFDDIGVGTNPRSVTLGDLDGDGNLDLVTANYYSTNASVRLNDGGGIFSATTQSEVAVGSGPCSIALGDVDGDGDLDLVTANYLASSASIRLNDGNGTFSPTTQSEIGVGTNPYSVALGDVDGDGDLDLVTANYGSNNSSIRLNDGSGTFSPTTQSEVGVGAYPLSVALGDLDGDGDLDLVTANYGSNNSSIRLNDGSGTFSPTTQSEVGVGAYPLSVALGDLDGDGDLDLVTANVNSSNASIRLNDGSGTFSPTTQSEIGVGTNPYSVALADVNGDGDLDLVTANINSSNVSIRLNDGSGSFSPTTQSEIGVGSRPISVALVDVDGDGHIDLVTANPDSNNASVRLNDGSGTFNSITQSKTSVGTSPIFVALGDVDGDGDLDLVTANAISNDASIRLNDGSGTFSPTIQSEIAVGGHGYSVALGDVDGDGDLDLATANQNSSSASIRINDGNGTFSPTTQSEIGVGTSPYSVALGDLDGDGDLDLVTANFSSNNASIRLNDGAGTFSAGSQSEVAVGPGPYSVALGDVDGDGDLDLVTASLSSSNVSIRLNDGSGTFSATTQSEIAVGTSPYSVALGDLDGDGDLDLVTANLSSNNASIRLNDGAGTFSTTTQSEIGVGSFPRSVALGDVDGDGDLDLTTANQNSNNASIRLNDGSGTFSTTTQSEIGVGSGPFSVALGDVDLDGDLDLLTANNYSNNASFFANLACP